MSGKYSVDDLLKLRASPLISKPSNLPAIEEWMGTQEPSGRRPLPRANKEETSAQNEPFQKRSNLLDAHRRTATDPERIVLGPPRRSFASSNARAAGKTQDGIEERERTPFNDRSKNGDDLETRNHERAHTQTNGRYGNRHESEDPEMEGRRDFDRKAKWQPRERNENEQDIDQASEETSRLRRDTQSRAKLAQSWFRKDTGGIEEDKAPDWRRDRGRDRDWDRDRYAKAEAEPEWMDSLEPEEPFQTHTQEDFQKWKERMKAGGAAPLEKIETSIASPPAEEKPSAARLVSAEPDDSMDKFFAKFEHKSSDPKSATVKATGKSKFASLFSPAAEQSKHVEFPLQQTQTPSTERPASAQAAGPNNDADQAGFARILEMLQTRSNNPTPQSQEAVKPRTPLYARSTEPRSMPEPKNQPDELLAFLATGRATSHQQLPEQLDTKIPEQKSEPDFKNQPSDFTRLMAGGDSRAQSQQTEQPYARAGERMSLHDPMSDPNDFMCLMAGGKPRAQPQQPQQHHPRAGEQKSVPGQKSHPEEFMRLMARGDPRAQPQQTEQSRSVAYQQRQPETKSPIEPATHTRQQSSINKDEVLLNLLRQASLAPKPQPQHPGGSGMFGISPDDGHRPMASRTTMISPMQAEQHAYRTAPRGSMFDESPVAMYSNDQGPREQGGRRPTNGAQAAYSEEQLIALLRQRNPQASQHNSQVYPPGLQRPPGLDQMQRSNPGWAAPQSQPQPQAPPRQASLPPGLVNIPRGMPGAPYGQPQQIPTQQAQQQQQQRPQQQPQRKYTSESSMPPNLPPGMYPPPGFMNSGPPPGFPGSMANHPAARFAADPGPQQRAFVDMYGEVGRGVGLRGGAGSGGMPPYR